MDKRCSKCGEVKPMEQFRQMHGRAGQPCLECHRAANKAWREANPDKMQAARDGWNANPENEARHKETESLRYVRDNDRIRQVMAVYQAANREKILDYNRRYHQEHKEAEREYGRKWGELNRDRKSHRGREWAAANPERKRELNREADNRRRARLLGAQVNDFTKEQWRCLKEQYDHRCAYCGEASDQLQQDHIHPLSKGGDHTLSNIAPACADCNKRKKDRTLEVAGMEFKIRIPI